eukprot:g689.t1
MGNKYPFCGWLLLQAATVAMAAPTSMLQVRTTGLLGCKAPFTQCVLIATEPMPQPAAGEVLVKVAASSVNPSDVDTVQLGGCKKGCGADFAGTVAACAPAGCGKLQVGDEVWGVSQPAFAEYVVASEAHVSLRPPPSTISAAAAATLPEVGLTSLNGLKRTVGAVSDPLAVGNPWANLSKNLTVVITSGGGGTGSLAIQLAKAWGAANIWTAASGDAGIAYVKALGATRVFDYKQGDLFDAIAEDSVDVVYDNYGGDGTPAKAMKALRRGGSYLLIPHGACYVSKLQAYPCLALKPKAGVAQLNYDTSPDFARYSVQGLDELAGMVRAGHVVPHVDRTFALRGSALAFNYSLGPGGGGVGDHIGKISIAVEDVTAVEDEPPVAEHARRLPV